MLSHTTGENRFTKENFKISPQFIAINSRFCIRSQSARQIHRITASRVALMRYISLRKDIVRAQRERCSEIVNWCNRSENRNRSSRELLLAQERNRMNTLNLERKNSTHLCYAIHYENSPRMWCQNNSDKLSLSLSAWNIIWSFDRDKFRNFSAHRCIISSRPSWPKRVIKRRKRRRIKTTRLFQRTDICRKVCSHKGAICRSDKHPCVRAGLILFFDKDRCFSEREENRYP